MCQVRIPSIVPSGDSVASQRCVGGRGALPGAVSSGMSKEYPAREKRGAWSLTSLTVMFSRMSEDWRPSSARTSSEYSERRSRSSRRVAVRSPDSGSTRKLSSAPLMMVYVTRALGP